MDSSPTQITDLLERWAEGDRAALDAIVPIVYERLRLLAHHRLRGAPGSSLNTTELVHEAYVKLVGAARVSPRDRCHFLALASRVMRNLLVDHARARRATKRGGGRLPALADLELCLTDESVETIVELDRALRGLEALDERQSRMLELRFFGGLSLDETADALGVSRATVKRELRSARAWLANELGAEPSL